jgi:lysophospholipid acyltransferase (LPLAT)-like uncharacterized protein
MIADQRGKHLALDMMTAEVQKGHNAGLAVDGPLGPYRKVKHGALVLAGRTGNPIVPVGTASSWKIVLGKRWDRYTIPLPFTRTVIAVGEPIFTPASGDPASLEEFRQELETRLLDLNRYATDRLNRQSRDPAV